MFNRLFTLTALSILLSASFAYSQAGGMKDKATEGCPSYGSRTETLTENRELSSTEAKGAAAKKAKEESEAKAEEGKAKAHEGGEETE